MVDASHLLPGKDTPSPAQVTLWKSIWPLSTLPSHSEPFSDNLLCAYNNTNPTWSPNKSLTPTLHLNPEKKLKDLIQASGLTASM